MNTKIELVNKEKIREEIGKLNTDLILIVVDSNIWQIYSSEFTKSLPEDKDFILFKSVEGEKTKNIEEFENGIEFFLEKGIHRKAHLLAIGGGATSDFGGYIAACLLRGISWSVIPTSLLSMVDAAIGGKTGINSRHGKNLIGAFHMPDHVWIDESFLSTLPVDEMKSGIGEVLKYGFLSKEIFDLLKQKTELSKIIKSCADHKEKVVREDFKENGTRMSLNLGHTFGHALEKIYDLSHGEAVFWGMALIYKFYQEEESDKYLKLLREFSNTLNIDFGDPPWLNKSFPVDKIMDYLKKDKKKASLNTIKIIKLKEIGQYEAVSIEIESIKELLESNKNELRSFNF